MPFVQGKSGNPSGLRRPRAKPKEISALAKSHSPLAINTLAKIARRGKTESARVAAAIALLDRGYGKPTTVIAGDQNAPLQVAILRFSDEPDTQIAGSPEPVLINENGHANGAGEEP